MLEDKIDQLIAKLDEVITAVTGAPGSTATASKAAKAATTAPATGTAKAPKITFDQVKAAVVRVKDEAGKPAAQKIIRDAGKASELAAIKAPQFEAVIAACEAALAEAAPEEEGAEDDSL